MTVEDFKLLRKMGIQGVRLLISSKLFLDPKAPATLKGEQATFDILPYLDKAIKTMIDNLIYSFHYYDPFPFTTQGAMWIGDEGVMALRNVPYPPSQKTCAQIKYEPESQKAKDAAIAYCRGGHDAAFTGYQFNAIARWAAGGGKPVPLYLGEFGVYCEYAPKADAARWIKDVRTAAEANKIAWSAFAYDNCFTIDRKRDAAGKITLREDVVEALGLADVLIIAPGGDVPLQGHVSPGHVSPGHIYDGQ
jgi:hypothetical protein